MDFKIAAVQIIFNIVTSVPIAKKIGGIVGYIPIFYHLAGIGNINLLVMPIVRDTMKII